jgi:large subunit ribosomal protein L3
MRSGVIAKKLGMTRLFMEDGKQIPVTVLQLDNLQVVAQRTPRSTATPPFSSAPARPRPSGLRQAMRGHFAKASVEPKRKIAEFRVAPRT